MLNLALVVETRRVPKEEIKEVAAAVQRQVARDFAPIWGIDASVDPFLALRDVPSGYWPIIVRDDFPGMNIIGIHLDRHGQPFALVRLNPTWSLTVSHEALEMISDPWGNRLTPGGSPKPGQGLVEMLVEVCDPPGGVAHAYTVNGYLVSDFVMPSYYEPVAVPGARYSFTGAITRPRSIVGGGYLAWREPTTREWWAWDWVNIPQPVFRPLGMLSDSSKPLRQQVDAFSLNTELFTGAPSDHPQVRAARARLASSRAVSRANAEELHELVAEIVAEEEGPLHSTTPPQDRDEDEDENEDEGGRSMVGGGPSGSGTGSLAKGPTGGGRTGGGPGGGGPGGGGPMGRAGVQARRPDPASVDQFLAGLPQERRRAMDAVRQVIRAHLPKGYEEAMDRGMITYVVPLDRYPVTYNARPLMFAALANQKRHMSLYLMGLHGDEAREERFRDAYLATGKRLDMGKSCVRFRTLDELPLELIGETIATISVDEFIEAYERARGITSG